MKLSIRVPVLISLLVTDLTISLTFPLTIGKFALVNDTAALDTSCSTDPKVVDLVGYGPTSCNETRALTPPTELQLLAHLRKGGGCTDSDSNFADFSAVTPLPRNSMSARNPCGGTAGTDRKSTRLNSSHTVISYA